MSAYQREMKAYIARYEKEVGATGLLDPHEIAAWAYEKGLHKPNVRHIIDFIAADIAQMFREEYRTDEHARRYRAKHAVTSKVGSKTHSLWADMDNPKAPRDHFIASFSNRRRGVVGDCLQLKTDVDVYNDKNPGKPAIQMPLDFTEDVKELQQLYQPPKAA